MALYLVHREEMNESAGVITAMAASVDEIEHSSGLILMDREEADEYTLMHYRVGGEKKGVRHYQNKDGSLTPEGRIHYGVGEGKKKRGDIASESDKDRAKREKKIEKMANKIEKVSSKIDQWSKKSEKYDYKAAKANKKAAKNLDRARTVGVTKALFGEDKSLSAIDSNTKSSYYYSNYVEKYQKSASLGYKSAKFKQKAVNGQKKLEKYREQLANLLPEDKKKNLSHAGFSENFFGVFETLSAKQKEAIYVMIDDMIPEEDLEKENQTGHPAIPK